MEVTEVRVRKMETGGNLKGYATITFDNCFVVHNIKIIEDKDSVLFIAMPSSKTRTGEYRDIVHPINSEFRNSLQAKILEAFANTPEG